MAVDQAEVAVASQVRRVWVGVDIGKQRHWAWALDVQGRRLLSRPVANDEADLLALLGEVAGLGAEEVVWAIDLTTVEAALLLAVLWAHDQQVRYLPGKWVNRAAAGYRSEGKTDAKDAHVIADQARLRGDLAELRPSAALVTKLRLLTARRADLVADRTRAINRLRQHLTAVCPALERVADLARQRAWAVLLAHDQRPKAIRGAGIARLASALVDAGVRASTAQRVATQAVTAAKSQTTRLAGEDVAAALVADLAEEVLRLDARITALDDDVQARFRRHRLAKVIASLPGFGFRLGAEFLAAVGDLRWFASADQLAAYAGLAPVPNDSGKRTGRLHRPQRYNRALRRVFYLSALSSLRCCAASRAYYDKKRAEGKGAKAASLPWHDGAPTSCGPCCATTAPGSPTRPSPPTTLDKLIETPLDRFGCGPCGPAGRLRPGDRSLEITGPRVFGAAVEFARRRPPPRGGGLGHPEADAVHLARF